MIMFKSTMVKLSVLHLIQSFSCSISLVCVAQKLGMEERGKRSFTFPHLLPPPSSVPSKVKVEGREIIEKKQSPSS